MLWPRIYLPKDNRPEFMSRACAPNATACTGDHHYLVIETQLHTHSCESHILVPRVYADHVPRRRAHNPL
jgi:hypothetical protein